MSAALETSSQTSTFAPPAFARSLFAEDQSAEGSKQSLDRGRVLRFAPDCEIYGEGDTADLVFRITSGTVRTCKFLNDGRRQIDAFYGVGDVFGVEAGEVYTLTAEAVSECALVPYRRSQLDTALRAGVEVSNALFSHAMSRVAVAQAHALLLARRCALEKVATFLLTCPRSVAATAVIELAMTRQDIADYLGLTIETVSRCFSILAKNRTISLEGPRHVHVLDIQGLSRLTN